MDTPTNTQNQIAFLIQHVAFSLSRLDDQVLQERLGIGFSQFKLMMVLQKKPHIQQKQIAKSLNQTEASISRQIKLLQEKGLLQTKLNPHNRREHVTTLTTKGQRFTDEANNILAGNHIGLFQELSPKQLEQLKASLDAIHRQTCKDNDLWHLANY